MHLLSLSLFAALSGVAVAAVTPTLFETRATCSTPQGSGTCQSTSSCGTFSVPGYCSGGTSNQCCVSKTCSTPSGNGTCKNKSKGCSGSFIAGYCPGSSDVQCCVGGTCSTPSGSGTCKSTSSCSGFSLAGYCPGGSDNQCCIAPKTCSTAQGSGTCKNTGNGCSGGTFVAGACPGSDSVKCCVPNTSTTCSTPSGNGKCQSTSSCGGFSLPGYCSGGTDNQCCLPSTSCSTSQGSGTCKNTGSGCSSGAFVSGACPGPSSVQCCVSGATPPPTGADVRTLDISSSKPASFYSCAAASYDKLIIRGYSQACGSGGKVDSNLAGAYSAAKAAGIKSIESYMFPCTGTQPTGVTCKSPETQLAEFEAAIDATGMQPVHLWFDVEPTSGECNAWNLGSSANEALAKQWVALLRKSKYKWGIYGNGNQWTSMFPSRSTDIGSDLPLWAVDFDNMPGVGTNGVIMGGWTSAYAKQYTLGTTVCGGTVDISSFTS